MTKTLGIKFKVRGVKEAQASVGKLKKGIDSALTQNAIAVEQYQKRVKRNWQEWQIENFGSKSQRQNLTIKRERRDFSKRSTYKNLNSSNRALVLEFRLAYKEFFTELGKMLDDKQNPNFFEKIFGAIGKPIGFLINAVLFPFQSAVEGAFSRMGEVQVQDFADGFGKSMQKALGLSFTETGEDVGKIIGNSLYKVYQRSVKEVDNYVKGKLQFNLADTLIEAFKYTAKTIAKEIPNLILRSHRRIKLNKEVIPQAKKAAGLKIVNSNLPEGTRQDIEKNKSISLIYGGANTDRADIGKDYTARVMKTYLKGSAVIPMTREWTNSALDSATKEDLRKLVNLIASNPLTAQTFKSFISQNGLDSLRPAEREEMMAALDLDGELDLNSVDRIADLVEALLSNKDFSLGKSLQATFMGYNPDDILGAAEAISLMHQFPDKELQIGGFSQGGYNALGAVDLLNRMGYTNVKGFSIGTPITGANATVNPDNFKSFMGSEDYYYKAVAGIGGDDLDFPEFFEVGEKEGARHSLQGYVRGDTVKGGLQEFLGDRVDIPSKESYGKWDSAYGYAVGELGAETALVRTLLTYLGESKLGAVEANEGFIFSAEESLPGYLGNIKKLGENLKDEDTNQFHAEYIDFLETLQAELETAEALAAIGKQYKPVASLKKAAKIFPQMEPLVAKHERELIFDPSKQSLNQFAKEKQIAKQAATAKLEADKELAAQKHGQVEFTRKVKQQKGNIERTFQAMLGRKFTAADEKKGIYSFYKEDDFEARGDAFEGMVQWLRRDVMADASPEEKKAIRPFYKSLKKISKSIKETGSTGQLDIETLREASRLFDLNLAEFDLLFDQLESAGETKLDVNHYQDELKLIRRNRDQILNEKQTPPEVAGALDQVQKELESAPPPPTVVDQGELALRYNQRLNRIIESASQKAVEAIADLSPEDLDRGYGEIRESIKEYRSAVSNGLAAQARDLGESILAKSELIKQGFAARGDRRSGQITRIQNEIVSGDAGRGRSGVPLAEVFTQSDLVQGELDLFGDTARGASAEINREAGQEIGSEFAEGIIEGAEDELDINSPSKVFEWIGSMVRAGFEGGVSGLGQQLQQGLESAAESAAESVDGIASNISDIAGELDEGEGLLDPLLQSEGADEELNTFFGDLINKFSNTFDGLVEKFPILGRIGGLLAEIGGEILQVVGVFSFGESLIEFSNQALAAAMQLESLERSIVAVSASASLGAQNISFIREQARELAVDLITAEEAYKRILGATRNTPLEGLQTQQIFTTLATTAKNRGLTTDATNRLFLGFEQAIAKGEFKAEEVRGQLAEVMGDIQNLLAGAMGVDTSELGNLMESGALKTVDVMPKLLAQLNAQNAALGGTSNTAAAAQTRYNNALLEYQDAVGRNLQPVQKMGLNSMATAFEFLREKAAILTKLFIGLGATVMVNLTLKFTATKLTMFALGKAIGYLIKAMVSLLPKLWMFAQRFVLITAAIDLWLNSFKIAFSTLKQLDRRVDGSTKRLEALAKAFEGAGLAAKSLSTNQPDQIQLNEGLNLADYPKWIQSIAGGDRLNWDNLLRNRIQKLDVKGFTTYAQAKQNKFVVKASDLAANVDTTLTQGYKVRPVVGQIQNLDRQARALQNQRLSIVPGDVERLAKILAQEKAIQKQRDQLLKASSQYQQSLTGDIQDIRDTLAELEQFRGGSTAEIDQRSATKKSLEQRLEALELEKKAIDQINARIPKLLSGIDRLIRDSGESLAGFSANQEDDALARRNETISEAIATGMSEAQLEVVLEDQTKGDLNDRVEFISQEITKLESALNSATVAEGVDQLGDAAANPATLERMSQEPRSAQQLKAIDLLLTLDDYEGQLAQAQSELVELTKTNRTRLRDNARTISDYFFKLNQELKEATLEGKKIISELFYSGLKNRLKATIAPGSSTFVNTVIDNVQGIIDQASEIAERVLGDRSALLGVRGENRTLDLELTDFIRSMGGATKAVDRFVDSLNGSSTPRSKVAYPVAGLDPTTAKITSGFGWRQIFGSKDFHEGIDIAAAGGSAVQAVNSGVVKYIYPLADQMQVGIETQAGALEWFIHLGQDLAVAVGERVNAGQVIGSVAHTTDYARKKRVSTGDHLDFRVHDGKGWVDPRSYLNRQVTPQATGGHLQAQSATDALKKAKLNNLALQRQQTEQQRQDLATSAADTIEKNRRQIKQSLIESGKIVASITSSIKAIELNFDFPSAAKTAAQATTALEQQLSDSDLQIDLKLQTAKDEIDSIKKLQAKLPDQIAALKKIGTPEAISAAQVSAESLAGLSSSLPQLEANYQKIQALQAQSAELQTKSREYLSAQNRLKIEQETLERRLNVLSTKSQIASARGSIAAAKKVSLKEEELKLQLAINQIEQQLAPGAARDEAIFLERQKSDLALKGIDKQANRQELELEQKLLEYQTQIANKRSSLGFGDLSQIEAQRKNAIASESLRFKKELADLNDTYAQDSQILGELTAKARELNSVNLRSIENEFKSLSGTLRQSFIEASQGFFTNFVNEGFSSQVEGAQQELEEKLRYAQQINQIEEAQRDSPGMLAHLKNRARALNEQKLDGIRNQFNLFTSTLNLAKNAIADFLKQLVSLAAQQAAAKFLGSILGNAIAPGASAIGAGNDFGGGAQVGAFFAAQGATVGSRQLPEKTTKRLKQYSGVRSAFAAEGSKARLGVFHVGEELLSRKTGEAGRYQALKRTYGFNPLAKISKRGESSKMIEIFKQGGTVDPLNLSDNLLNRFGSNARPNLDLSVLERGKNRSPAAAKTISINQTIVSPDADSFKLNEDQRNQDLIERLRRGIWKISIENLKSP